MIVVVVDYVVILVVIANKVDDPYQGKRDLVSDGHEDTEMG